MHCLNEMEELVRVCILTFEDKFVYLTLAFFSCSKIELVAKDTAAPESAKAFIFTPFISKFTIGR